MVALVAACGAGMYFAGKAHHEKVQALSPLIPACQGRPVPGARALQPGVPHRMVGVMLGSSGWDIDLYRVDQTVRSDTVANTDLVLCFQDEVTTTLETCHYSTYYRGRTTWRNDPRTQVTVRVRAVAAATGQTVAEGVVEGHPPMSCPPQGGTSNGSFGYRGSAPSSDDIRAWVQRSVP